MKGEDASRFMSAAQAENQRVDRYLPWRKLRYRTAPSPLTMEEWWWGIKLQRFAGRESLPLLNRKGEPFSYSLVPYMHKLLHEIDILCGSKHEKGDERDMATPYLLYSLEEESIMSSLIEGAITTRAAAKSMIRQRRKPLSHGERMIYNNYKVMQHIQDMKDEPFSTQAILELHSILTHDTLEESAQEGCFRSATDDVRVEDSRTGEIVHLPPDAEQLPERMQALCDFANQVGHTAFMHPVIRACILHFWLAYDHPFVDGNGRTARALFYWYMLKAGYRHYEYISISRQILEKPKRYYQSFVDTEEDEGDLNYFIIAQLLTIKEAVENLYAHIAAKKQRRSELYHQLRNVDAFNYRQQALVAEFLRNQDTELSVRHLAENFRISQQTARGDLTALHGLGLLRKRKQGQQNIYYAHEKIARRIEKLIAQNPTS